MSSNSCFFSTDKIEQAILELHRAGTLMQALGLEEEVVLATPPKKIKQEKSEPASSQVAKPEEPVTKLVSTPQTSGYHTSVFRNVPDVDSDEEDQMMVIATREIEETEKPAPTIKIVKRGKQGTKRCR
ncbi:hypothetical protein AbHV_ORF17 [Abalone herpesvirus Victoria/AUS/2009]|uniref:Uncharacterized protein n=1 Tax=Abalone herpesvirus (isolate Abalone/Australia/Victoria/2009) TaxID=1241371 RepID=K4K8F7_ABHV|nr:hypothetical protein AbHV_ORF17 [Abalone herpesvirus Victoria/AUS/2009]AFU90027.1 hypothetical protein AbHV_ORF17 [Abalone herpesvirus Victoria/AUS/2009]